VAVSAAASVVSLTKILLDPLVAVLVLIGCTLYFDEPFRGPYPILALIVFTLTFPGKWPEVTPRAFWNEVVMPWFFLAGLILLFGYSTGYLDWFPPNLVMRGCSSRPSPCTLRIGWCASSCRACCCSKRAPPRHHCRRRASGLRIARRFTSDSALGVDVVGFSTTAPSNARYWSTPTAARQTGRHPEYVNRNGIDLVYVTLPMASQPRTLSCSTPCATPPPRSTSCPTSSFPTSSRRASTTSTACPWWR